MSSEDARYSSFIIAHSSLAMDSSLGFGITARPHPVARRRPSPFARRGTFWQRQNRVRSQTTKFTKSIRAKSVQSVFSVCVSHRNFHAFMKTLNSFCELKSA